MEDMTMVLQLLSEFPLLIPIQDNIVISPTQEEFIMPSGVPQLVVWPLSGIAAEQEVFQKEPQGYWDLHGETKLNLHMGIADLGSEIEIPLRALNWLIF